MREVELQTENKTEDFSTNADYRTIEQTLSQEIAEGQVEVKIDDEKIVVELKSPAKSGADGDVDKGNKQSGVIDPSEQKILAKVDEARAKVDSEVVVKDQSFDKKIEAKEFAESNRENGSDNNKEQNLDEQMAKIRMELSEDIAKGLAEVERKGDQIIVRLAEQGSFRSGFADIQPTFEPLLNRVGKALSSTQGRITVEGHTDNVPIAFSERFQSNWDLSAARSAAVADYLLGGTELQQGRVMVAGFADTRPLGPNDTAEGRSRNRRIEIIVDGN